MIFDRFFLQEMERFREHEKEFKTKQYSQKALMNAAGGKNDTGGQYNTDDEERKDEGSDDEDKDSSDLSPSE